MNRVEKKFGDKIKILRIDARDSNNNKYIQEFKFFATPSFVLLDEPLAGIDPIAVNDIRELIRHLSERGIGVLITEHNVRDTLEIVDRAYIIHDGTVFMDGSPEDIVANDDVRRVYLGEQFKY